MAVTTVSIQLALKKSSKTPLRCGRRCSPSNCPSNPQERVFLVKRDATRVQSEGLRVLEPPPRHAPCGGPSPARAHLT